ncbi:phospholipase D family protein [Pelagovum pacificum]|nr:phospholipase D-like domain-containing protein [Pelagovum pacificum]QQA41863.1 phospholipase [Pelagovum pacificum]
MSGIQDIQLLLTAAEAYPAFEERVASAQKHINASFRIFDPFTRLRSDAAKKYGNDWFDLLVGKLAEGVSIELRLTDFDPVARTDLHRQTWASLRALWAAGEASGHPENLKARALMHPARSGYLMRALFWPYVRHLVRREVKKLDTMSVEGREEALSLSPLFAPLLDKTNKRARFWPPSPLVPATHHQKLAVIDSEWLYIGGLDLDERRYDTPMHNQAPELTWHDVQVLVRGPVVAEAERHLSEFEDVNNAKHRPGLAGDTFRRTLSAKRTTGLAHISPKTISEELLHTNLDGIASARNLIYIETQFFRDRRIAKALAEAARTYPDLHMVAVLPAAPEDVAFMGDAGPDARFGEFQQARAVMKVTEAFGPRVFFASPARSARQGEPKTRRDHLDGAPIIYVHAKLAVFDGQRAIVSSANLNGRSLSWDTEAGLRLEDAATAELLLQRCLDHWTISKGPKATDGGRAIVDSLRDLAVEDRARDPEKRQGLLLPYSVTPARRFGRNLPGIPEKMV